MKFQGLMIVVKDIEISKKFYVDVLHEKIGMDLGNYVVFKDSFSMMTREQWNTFTNDSHALGENVGHNFELYFEEDNLDEFVRGIEKNPDIIKFTPLEEAPWGQHTYRFLDPDGHVIEVSETMQAVVKRLLSSGMTVQEASEKSMMPIAFVKKCETSRSNDV